MCCGNTPEPPFAARYWYGDANPFPAANSDSNTKPNAYIHAYKYAHPRPNPHINPDKYANSYPYLNAHEGPDRYANVDSDATPTAFLQLRPIISYGLYSAATS